MSEKIDKKYISLQFWKKIHEKTGSQFQDFFSDIMQSKYPSDFKKVRPYGVFGDDGNDGYVPSRGIYYQVYAPLNPNEKSMAAAEKMIKDFNTLKDSGWGDISEIKEYIFVFNDKNFGSDSVLETAKSQLSKENPGIAFDILLPIQLEQIFLNLPDDKIVLLGFDLDSRKALEITRHYLKELEIELDRGHVTYANQRLETIREIIKSQGDEAIMLDFEVIEARTLYRLEKIDEAKIKYANLIKLYPGDIRAYLYLAEHYLIAGNKDQNKRLLDEATKIDPSHWLYKIQMLIKSMTLGESVSIENIDTASFPADPIIKSDFYRLYGKFLEQSGDKENAAVFVERAIHFNPEKIINYDIKIAFDINSLTRETDDDKIRSKSEEILKEITSVNNKFNASGNTSNRSKVYLNYKKAMLLIRNERFDEFTSTTTEVLELIRLCYFDSHIDGILSHLLSFASLPDAEFEKILDYINSATNSPSKELSQKIFLQFMDRNELEDKGKAFFEKNKLTSFSELIEDFEKKDYNSLVSKIKDDNEFAVMISIAAANIPELGEKIIEILPDNVGIQKNKLKLILEDGAGNLDAAFALFKEIDLSKLNYIESQMFLRIAKNKDAWEFVILFAKNLISYEKAPEKILALKLDLFNANSKLDRLPEVVKIGEEILENKQYLSHLDLTNKNALLCHITSSLLKRSTQEDLIKAKTLVEKYTDFLSDFPSNAGAAADVYLRLKDGQKALDSVIRGVKFAKRLSPEEYASLFLTLNTIENLIDLKLTNNEKIGLGDFIKFKDEDDWYFVGNEDNLDAYLIPTSKQIDYLGKKVGDKITPINEYSSKNKERVVESIFTIEKYITWKSSHFFQKLSTEGTWEGAIAIEVPHNAEGGLDLKNVIAVMEKQQNHGKDFFKLYCEQNLPFAMLAASEGGFTRALGKILNEQKGFIKMSDGTLAEFTAQKELATKIIDNKEPFYLDGTSALILTETGLLNKIHQFIPNLKVPQSVISLLLDVKNKFNIMPGQAGQMHLTQGEIGYSELNPARLGVVEDRFSEATKLLELNPENIGIISSASKENKFSERDIPASLCDAAVLAQKENLPILTEDFLYLHYNEIETKKTKPLYFSSMALIRVLYEKGNILFDEYLDFFSYLAAYRFRYLQITTEDLTKAIFGEGSLTKVNLENIKKLHIPLTFSEEYGANQEDAVKILLQLIVRLLVDDSISLEDADKVYTEMMSSFPTKQNKSILGKALIPAAKVVIDKYPTKFPEGVLTKEKIDKLINTSEHFAIVTAEVISK